MKLCPYYQAASSRSSYLASLSASGYALYIIHSTQAKKEDVLSPYFVSSSDVGSVTLLSNREIELAPGHVYEINYSVNAHTREEGQIRVVPFLNAEPCTYCTGIVPTTIGSHFDGSVTGTLLVNAVCMPIRMSLHYEGSDTTNLAGEIIIQVLNVPYMR